MKKNTIAKWKKDSTLKSKHPLRDKTSQNRVGMERKFRSAARLALVFIFCFSGWLQGQEIPLPEHPRPDFMRPLWMNLNGPWGFAFDTRDAGLKESWYQNPERFDSEITVPFPWGAPLSGREDEADIGWYFREVEIPDSWKGKRIFLIIGAADWETTVWMDSEKVGGHRGGYVPIELELTPHVQWGASQELVIRVDDARRDFTLYGKQGYGNARGIWQTVYLEARGETYVESLQMTPDIDRSVAVATVRISDSKPVEQKVALSLKEETTTTEHTLHIPAGAKEASLEIAIPDARLWSLEDPFLYTVSAQLGEDTVETYFGMREISVRKLPGTEYPYIALNGKPVYLQMALDQSYHPEGFYTFPSDDFMREEIERSKAIGLNGIRTHIKVEVPRKLYWADKLGLLVMSDLPNSWGEPDRAMQQESEYTLRAMIRRDFNHPSVFSWIVFNETWGLTREGAYTRDTQNWVASMYYLAKSLDTTRLVEDNSICCGFGHTETDINSWHAYLPGYKWDEQLQLISEQTYPGSSHHFEDGFVQGNQPNINSECGNVWGYEGSTGDVDWSWDYHRMLNSFRKYPKIAGWLYTEHHDVVNEWNGYWRFDRSEKITGMDSIMPGMSLKDLHAGVYLSTGNEICRDARGGDTIEIPLFLSDMEGKELGPELRIDYQFHLRSVLGQERLLEEAGFVIPYSPWMQEELAPLTLKIPGEAGIGRIGFTVSTISGEVLSRNFMHLDIQGEPAPPSTRLISLAPSDYTVADWSGKLWEVMDGYKVNGAGSGFFEYHFELPPDLEIDGLQEAYFLFELSAKPLLVKDREDYRAEQDFMKGSVVAPSSNPNAYPMTDQQRNPSRIALRLNGSQLMEATLPDDPADHRGVLSWHHQLKDGKLREAGTFGYLVRASVDPGTLARSFRGDRILKLRLETKGEGGIAIYGKSFGRYALDPSLVLQY